MAKFFEHNHLITNFPKHYPLHKKIYANLLYLLVGIAPLPRKDLLTPKDAIKARFKLRKGDILLVGDLKPLLSNLLGDDPVTHAVLNIGKGKFIEAKGDGVKKSTFKQVISEYDTLAILRIPKKIPKRRKIIRKAIKYAKSQIGKPYDFEFNKKQESFFCTMLVNQAYLAAGYKTKLRNVHQSKSLTKQIEKQVSNAVNSLRAVEFTKGNFDTVFLSHNLKLKNKKLQFIKE